jgi:hypothetical protein
VYIWVAEMLVSGSRPSWGGLGKSRVKRVGTGTAVRRTAILVTKGAART